MQAIKSSKKLSIYQISLIGILVSLLLLIQSCGAANKYGAATPDRIVDLYLTALENRSEGSIQHLMSEQATGAPAIAAKIAKLGGHKIQNRQVNYTKSKPILWNANIRGFYIDRAGVRRRFDDSIAIEYQSKGQVKLYGGRWYLLL
jgi:hypothetical protein